MAVGAMWGGAWVIGTGMAAFALNLAIFLAVTSGTTSATGIWRVLLYLTSGWVLLGIAVSLFGAFAYGSLKLKPPSFVTQLLVKLRLHV